MRSTTKALVRILDEYGLFSSLFLETYISGTKTYYTADSQQQADALAKRNGQGEFVQYCWARMKEEDERSESVLGPFEWCWAGVTKAAERALLEERLGWLRLGIENAVDEENIEGMERMYSLFSRVGGQRTLCESFKAHVQV